MLDTCFCYVTLTCWQDRGESPFDPVYDKVLSGLNLVARHAAMPLLDALLAWRKDAESMAQRAGMELVVLRKKVCRVHSCCVAISFVNISCCQLHKALLLQLAVETVFLEASNQLVGPGSSGLSGRQAEALERLAFDWALNAETYVEPKFSDLTRAREKVWTAVIDRSCSIAHCPCTAIFKIILAAYSVA